MSAALQYDVITLFPELFDSLLSTSLLGKAVQQELLQVRFTDPRDFTHDRHRTIDDTPYGGGEGMVIKPEPLAAAIEAVSDGDEPPWRVLLTPQGEPLQQRHLSALAGKPRVALICGRYEGFDERVRSLVDQELSLGDFVLNGGEVAAMAIIDGTARLVPGVIGNAGSLTDESHAEGLLEYPQYTRPPSFRGQEVPPVLLSGDHAVIASWRRQQMLLRTRRRRPDLWQRFQPTAEDLALLAEHPDPRALLAARTYVALLHHPVYDRSGEVVTTAVTNLDLHDIARSSRTYGLAGYFVVTPLSSQQELARRISEHWRSGHGARYNKRRSQALSILEVAGDLDQVRARISEQQGAPPVTVATSAVARPGQLSRDELFASLSDQRPLLLLLGTGWGLTEEFLQTTDLSLAPLKGWTNYNHLSVRSAAAILLDRLFGCRD